MEPRRSRSGASRASAARSERRSSRHDADVPEYEIPDSWTNLDELAGASPVAAEEEVTRRPVRSLERTRTHEQQWHRLEASRSRAAVLEGAPLPPEELAPTRAQVSKAATHFYTLSYLVFFALLGTLARVGLTALTTYPGTPLTFPTIWANVAGSLIMGFLAEERMLFRDGFAESDSDSPGTTDKRTDDVTTAAGLDQDVVDLAAAKKAHLATKKTIPLYIGLATGFCGSFTSFSSFIRDVFLALSNDLANPGSGGQIPSRSGGYSFLALLGVIIATVSLSLSALVVGTHLAIACERITPSLPYNVIRRYVDRIAVVLGWGCWLGAVFMCIFPPHDKWRGTILFSLVFAPLGCLARFYLALHLNGKLSSFPVGTFVANVAGTAVLGMAWDVAHARIGGVVGCQVLHGVEDGFCGCLTTISTWVAELSSLRKRNSYVYGSVSVVVSLVLLIAIMGGLRWSADFRPMVCSV